MKTTIVVMVTVMIQPACEGLGVEALNKTRGDDNTQYEEAPTRVKSGKNRWVGYQEFARNRILYLCLCNHP